LIGEGGTGKVFEAFDVTLKRPVALKVLPHRYARGESDQQIQRFLQEARTLAAIDHPGVVKVYEVDHDDGLYFVAMELVEGRTLSEIIEQDGPVDPEQMILWLDQAARALHEAQLLGIVHRDIKPDNLINDPTGRCRVVDFGLATGPDDAFASQIVRAGTEKFAAPELWRGGIALPQSDRYSLAATGWFTLFRSPPDPPPAEEERDEQEREQEGEQEGEQKREEEPDPREQARKLAAQLDSLKDRAPPPTARDALVTALSASPERRFRSLAEFADALTADAPRRAEASRRAKTSRPAPGARGSAGGGSHAEPAVQPDKGLVAATSSHASEPKRRGRPLPHRAADRVGLQRVAAITVTLGLAFILAVLILQPGPATGLTDGPGAAPDGFAPRRAQAPSPAEGQEHIDWDEIGLASVLDSDHSDLMKQVVAAGDKRAYGVRGRVQRVERSETGKAVHILFEQADLNTGFYAVYFPHLDDAMTRALGAPPSEALEGREVLLKGSLKMFHGRPQMLIRTPRQLELQPAASDDD